jgi:hypothetical protein
MKRTSYFNEILREQRSREERATQMHRLNAPLIRRSRVRGMNPPRQQVLVLDECCHQF